MMHLKVAAASAMSRCLAFCQVFIKLQPWVCSWISPSMFNALNNPFSMFVLHFDTPKRCEIWTIPFDARRWSQLFFLITVFLSSSSNKMNEILWKTVKQRVDRCEIIELRHCRQRFQPLWDKILSSFKSPTIR